MLYQHFLHVYLMISVRRHQHWIIALLVLVFLGQSLAVVAMPCQLMETGSATDHDMVAMDYSMMGMHHDMSQMDQSKKSLDMSKVHDCCKTMGHCISSSCSVPALSYNLTVRSSNNSDLIVDLYSPKIPKSPVTSLYRPPIFR